MILYFSATGNCRYVAEHIAHDIGDTAVSIEKHCGKIQLMQNEMLGIVAPTYAWELPINIADNMLSLSQPTAQLPEQWEHRLTAY